MAKGKKIFKDMDEDHRHRGSWWTYWDVKKQAYTGPDIRGSVLAYQAWSPKMKDGRKLIGAFE